MDDSNDSKNDSCLTSTPIKGHSKTPDEFFSGEGNIITPMPNRTSSYHADLGSPKQLNFDGDDSLGSEAADDVAMKTVGNDSDVSAMNVDSFRRDSAGDSLEGDENTAPSAGDVSRDRSLIESKKPTRTDLLKQAAANRFANMSPNSKADRMQRAARQRGSGRGRRHSFDSDSDKNASDASADVVDDSMSEAIGGPVTSTPKTQSLRESVDQSPQAVPEYKPEPAAALPDDSDVVIESSDEDMSRSAASMKSYRKPKRIIESSDEEEEQQKAFDIDESKSPEPKGRNIASRDIVEQSFGSSTGSANNPIQLQDDSTEDEAPKEPPFTATELNSVAHLSRVELLEAISSLKHIPLANAPDGGAKIRRRLALLEHMLERVPSPTEIQIIDEIPGPSRPPVKKLAQVEIDRYLTEGKRLYGGAMTNDRIEKVEAVTEEVVTRLYSSIEKAPENVVTESPDGINVELMLHQKHGLTWMLWRESQQPHGGILADDMGLGKTLSMISLILEQKNRRLASPEEKEKQRNEMKAHFKNDPDVIPAFSTLVIAPASVIYQWEAEIEKRVPNNRLKVYVFHGPKREMNPKRLACHDIVITTYSIISSELGTHKADGGDETDDSDDGNASKSFGLKKGNQIKKTIAKGITSPLTKVGWQRIILDEAHNIKNRKSLMSRGCCRLPAYSRWALTGTPIHNNLWDLFSLVRFLRVNPFGEEKLWKEFIMCGGQLANDRLNALVKGLLIRRTKNQMCPVTEKPLVDLKPRTFEVVEIDLQGLEYMCYQHMFEASQQKAKEIINQQNPNPRPNASKIRNPFLGGTREVDLDDKFQTMSCLLVLLLRLRQACVHMALTKNAVDIDAFKEDGGTEGDVLDELEKTLGNISLGGDNGVLVNPDGTKVCVEDIFEVHYKSAKVQALIERLDVAIEAGDKSVVVSQWTSMLDIIEWHLQKRKVEYTAITGAVLTKDRQARVDSFNQRNGGAQVMLLSLTAGGVGLNLVGGNHLFLTDLHWNPALEQQACDRIYRMGQTKSVFIHKLVCKETIEQRVLDLQEKKVALANSVLDGAAKKNFKLTMNDIKFLFDLRSNRQTAPPKEGPYQGPNNVRMRE
uniref:Transcription termination factor 2 n=1 Tax=Panagrellus redivivus TaxID=6233 RepID=A0A7E4VHX9_PANRE